MAQAIELAHAAMVALVSAFTHANMKASTLESYQADRDFQLAELGTPVCF
jgi:hypothetical protein